jgi:hypothetical protein
VGSAKRIWICVIMPETDHPVAVIAVKAFCILAREPHVSMRILGNGSDIAQPHAISAFYQVKF